MKTSSGQAIRPYGDGCEWFRTCEECQFGDCEAAICRMAHGSRQAMARVGAAMAHGLGMGAKPEELGMFFGMPADEVTMVAKEHGSRLTVLRAAARGQAIAARQAGESEHSVAVRFSVSPRTVRLWCMGVEGIDRGRNAASAGRSILARLATAGNSRESI